jgi:predicted N-acetyltransferase YhbS
LFNLAKIRRLDQCDLESYDKLLEQLGPVYTNCKERENILRERNYGGCSPTFVWLEGGVPVGTATLYVLDKLQFRYPYAIIDDVAVLPEFRGKGIAKELVRYCLTIAQIRGCFKVILDCDSALTSFYEKFGFYQNGTCMRIDL